MDEMGTGIVADPAETQGLGGVPDLAWRAIGEADIDGAANRMEAVGGNAAVFRGEDGIGLRAAIAADHLERLLAADPALQIAQQIEKMGIDPNDLIIVMITQDEVDFLEGARVVLAVFPVSRVDRFAGMFVAELQASAAGYRHGGLGQARRQGQCGSTQAQTQHLSSCHQPILLKWRGWSDEMLSHAVQSPVLCDLRSMRRRK